MILLSFNFRKLLLKWESQLPKFFFICFKENPFNLMKNTFYFTLKALFDLKIFKFLSWPFGHVEKWLNQKDKVNFKFNDAVSW